MISNLLEMYRSLFYKIIPLICLAGCTPNTKTAEFSPEDTVQGYFLAIQQGNYTNAYSYFSEEDYKGEGGPLGGKWHFRGRIPFDEYEAGMKNISSFKLIEIIPRKDLDNPDANLQCYEVIAYVKFKKDLTRESGENIYYTYVRKLKDGKYTMFMPGSGP